MPLHERRASVSAVRFAASHGHFSHNRPAVRACCDRARAQNRQRLERTIIIGVLSAVLVLNYIAYLIFVRSRGIVDWRQMLPLQLCDWGMVVVIVAMWTGNQRWFEVAYFWGIGGTLQAVLTPNLRFGFPDLAVHQFFYLALLASSSGVVFLMLTQANTGHIQCRSCACGCGPNFILW